MTQRHFMHVFPTFDAGGVQIRMASVLSNFGNVCRHTIIALDGKFRARSHLDAELAVEYLAPGIHRLSLPGRVRAIRSVLRERRPDLLLTYNWGAIEWALANRLRPLCRHFHLESGFGPEEATRQIRRRVWLRRLALGNISGLIVPSRTLAEIAKDVWRIDPRKINLIRNGVNVENFARAPDRTVLPAFDKRDDEVIVGTIAPLRAEKNLDRLLRVFARLDGAVRLLIVGDGPESARLEQAAAALNLGDRVIFTGFVDRPERIIGLFDVYALSSDTEQMPNTVLQAMAAGQSVAGLAVGDVRDIVSPDNRPLIADPGDETGLERNLRRLVEDSQLRDSVGLANREHVRRHYDEARMHEAYGRVLGVADGWQ